MPFIYATLEKKAVRQEEQDVEKGDHCGINIADIPALYCARITFLRVGGVSLAEKLYIDVFVSLYLIRNS